MGRREGDTVSDTIPQKEWDLLSHSVFMRRGGLREVRVVGPVFRPPVIVGDGS